MCWDKCCYYLITDHNYTTMVGSSVLIYNLSWLVPHPFKYPKVVKHVHVGPENSYGKGQSTFARNDFTRSQLYPSETLISSVTWHSNIYLNSIFTVHFCLYRRYLTWVFFFAEREINRKKNIIQRSKSTISLLYGAMWLLVSQWVPCILGYIFSYKTILAIFFPQFSFQFLSEQSCHFITLINKVWI